jgi:hypothetical protein
MKRGPVLVFSQVFIIVIAISIGQLSFAKDKAPTDTSVRPGNVAPGDWTSKTAPIRPDPAMEKLLKNAYSNCVKQGTPIDECKKMFK